VFFYEWVDPGQLHDLMRDYHVFIHPSCYSQNMDCEGGAPIVLLDAQATGLPVISTTHCDIPDEVSHGLTGLLSPEKDVESLAKSIEIFYHMGQDEYDEFSVRARLHVSRTYDIRSNAKKLRQLYQEIISGSQG
jgi:colanic acid/amylovoran biosynthesis glycosyltransferase